jgi:hypothetical protein
MIKLFIVLFVACFAIAVYLQFSLTIGDPDGFYHAKIAILLGQGELLTTLPWMQFSTLKESFTDHHFLYHLILVPIVKLDNPLLGVKLATAIFMAGFFTVFYWLLKRWCLSAPLVYTVLLLSTSAFVFRLGLIKANSLSLIVLLLIFFALFAKRWWWLAALNFIYVWLYGGWLLSWLVVAIYTLVSFFHGRFSIREVPWYKQIFVSRIDPPESGRAVLATLLGSLLGLLLNPYWPQNIYFYWQQVWQIAIVNQGSVINVGGEWSTLPPLQLVAFFSFILIAYGMSLFVFVINAKRVSARTWIFFTLSFICLIFTAKSRRYIELSAPLMLIFAASSWSDIFPRAMLLEMWRSWKPPTDWLKTLLVSSVLVGLVAFFLLPNLGPWSEVKLVHDQLANGIPLDRYQKASHWLKENTPAGATIVHSDWDDWPMLFYHNTHNFYIVGLDPTFMYNYDKALYRKWANLTKDGVADNLVNLMKNELQSEYALIERDHTGMQELFATNIYFRLVYEDDQVWIYNLNNSI